MNISEDLWRKRAFLSYLLAFVLGCLFLFLAQTLWTFLTFCHGKDNLLNPRLPCEGSIEQGEWDYEPLRDVLTSKKAKLKAGKKVSHISIYFRDLTHGPRFGIGEYDKFHPASLSKVPVLIAVLHEADRDPSLLDRTLSFSGTITAPENTHTTDTTIVPNTPYTIRELLRKMIVYSDNFSYVLLVQHLNTPAALSAYYTFRDLDILRMMLAPKADYVSIQSYGNLFAVLYSTGYLSKDMSQFALELLSQTTYKDGLAAGVPENVLVAHKFGYRDLTKAESQLHDCGIVYHPWAPYILCVMTSGFDVQTEAAVIADVSRTVYDAVSSLAFRGL